MKKTVEPAPASHVDLRVGTLLGRRQAFNLVAARCSAADAACLREIRNHKAYKSVCADWSEFCSKHLRISQTNANRIIRYLDEFGPEYFELAQLTAITPKVYRAIAPAVKNKAVHCEGAAIALLPENTEKLAAAVAELRRAAEASPTAQSMDERLCRLERRSAQLLAQFQALVASRPEGVGHVRLASMLIATRQRLERIELELGPQA